MKVWSICVAISVNITDIWTTFGTEHKYHTINTPEWPNSHKLKIQDGGGRHLEFRKNVNNFGLDKDILHQIIWKDARRRRGEDHVVQKSKPEVNLRDVIKWRSEAYVRRSQWLSRIFWTKFYTELKHRTSDMKECSKFTWLENPRRWRPPSWISITQ